MTHSFRILADQSQCPAVGRLIICSLNQKGSLIFTDGMNEQEFEMRLGFDLALPEEYKYKFPCKVVLCALVLCSALPSKKDAAPKKSAAAQQKNKCTTSCSMDFVPICAGDGVNKPISFGNTCVLEKYNCENQKVLKKVSDGECPNSQGVRLS